MVYSGWRTTGYDRDTAVSIVKGGINPLVAVLCASRGFKSADEIVSFEDDSLERLHDPMLMTDMDKAVARVRRAIEGREHVAVFGDYDVDGITASVLMAEWLRSKGLECEIYIPDRYGEGYGVNIDALKKLAEKGVTLVITVDCGITATHEAAWARENGLSIVITDHHEYGGVLPDADAVVDPRRPDCPYPFKGLAGVGVAFSLARAVDGPEATEDLLNVYGDIVAIGTVADVMPVTDENRVYIKRGLEAIKEGRRPGVASLLAAAGLDSRPITAQTLSFGLAPRINAAGRLGRVEISVELLISDDPERTQELAEELCQLNRQRQTAESDMFDDAQRMLEESEYEGGPLVLAGENWHQGVAGIVASRLAEKYQAPCLMICLADGRGRGSCRSWGSFNIYTALARCSDILEVFGGHEMAAGLTIKQENIPAFRERMRRIYKEHPAEEEAKLAVDFEVIKPSLLSLKNVEALSALEPCGNGNPPPVLSMTGVSIDAVTPLSMGRHTKLRVTKLGESFDCVFFSKSIEELGLQCGGRSAVAFTPQINEFRGRRSVQLLLSDVRPM